MDIDEASVKASRENADANGIAPEQFAIGLGSVTEVLAGRFPIRHAPLVLANILAPIIIRLFGWAWPTWLHRAGLHPLRDPGRAGRGGDLSAEEHGLKFVEKRQMGDWVALA